jgi:hypothetical protein
MSEPILTALCDLPCIDVECVVPIKAGDPVVLTSFGYAHAHHQENA